MGSDENRPVEGWTHPSTSASFQSRRLGSTKCPQAHRGHTEQARVNLLSVFGKAAWRWEHHSPPQLSSKENLPSSPSTDLANLKYNGATDLLLSGSRSKGEGRVWASNKTKPNWNKEGHLDGEKKEELCKSNDIFDGTKSILVESQALDPGRRFESSPWIRSTLNKTLTIHWESAHVCAWISSLVGLLLRDETSWAPVPLLVNVNCLSKVEQLQEERLKTSRLPPPWAK